MRVYWTVLRHDLLLAGRQGGETVLALFSFALGALLFPLGLGPDSDVLAEVGPGLLWVVALLAVLLSLDRLFRTDFEDGTLDALLVLPEPMETVVLAKCTAHWLTTGLPITILAPLLGLMLTLPFDGLGTLALAFALGTPALTLIGAVGAAVTVDARRGGALVNLLVLPLYVPILIFGAGAAAGRPGAFALLGAVTLGALALAPFAAAAALRQVPE